MTPRSTPTRTTPPRAGTPVRGAAPVVPDLHPHASMAVKILTGLALIQGLFFLLPLSSPIPRLLGIALTLATLLASRVLQESPPRRAMVLSIIALLIGANFVWHLIGTAPAFAFRLWQLTILLGYSALLLAGLTYLAGVDFRKGLNIWGAVFGALWLAEAMIGGPDAFSPTTKKVEWVGAVVQDSALGEHFAPNTVVKTFYPDNPRGYFDEPDALQRRWAIQVQEGSQALLEFPPDRRGVIRTHITAAPGKVDWHIALKQAPIRVIAEERYEVRFRARADSIRTIVVAVGQDHAPWQLLGLYRELRVDTTWREFTVTFRATASDRASRLYFNLGADRPSVDLLNVVMRRISANQAIQAEARRELSVSYRINSQGCRGAEYQQHANPGAWRILSLGDGSSFGVGVHENDTYAARLESLLNESGISRGPQDHYDVINCGVKGLSTVQEQSLFNLVGVHYAPNVVLLAVNPDDDRFHLEDNQQPAGSSVAKIEQLFHLWGVVHSVGARKPPAPNYASILGAIKGIDADARARGARLAVILFQHRMSPDWTTFDSTLTNGLSGSNIPVLKLGRVLLAFGEEKLLVHEVYDHHPNELAHRISAEALRKFLADQGMLGEARMGAQASDTTRNPR